MKNDAYYTDFFGVDEPDSACQADLLRGKIKIYEVPLEYRDADAYSRAIRSVLGGVDGSAALHTEFKLIESLLLQDILTLYVSNRPRSNELRRVYEFYLADPDNPFYDFAKRTRPWISLS